MFEGTKAWTAIQSTMGGVLRARRQHGMREPPQAYHTLFTGQRHTCVHIMKNLRCTGFEATSRLAAILYWAVRRAAEATDTPDLMDLAQDFRDSSVMALSKGGESGPGSRNGVWKPTSIAEEIIEEMEFSYQETAAEITKLLSQTILSQQGASTTQPNSQRAESPFPAALQLASQKFAWDEDDLHYYSNDIDHWTLSGAYEIADAFGLDREDFDHQPWELHPLLQAAIHIARHEMVQVLVEDIRHDDAKTDEDLQSLNPINLMLLETGELSSAAKHLEIAEAMFEVSGMEWEEGVKGNAHFFAKNLDKIGLSRDVIRERLITLVKNM